MKTVVLPMPATLAGLLRTRALLHLEILALRQQLAMVTARDRKRLRFRQRDRLLWIWLYYVTQMVSWVGTWHGRCLRAITAGSRFFELH